MRVHLQHTLFRSIFVITLLLVMASISYLSLLQVNLKLVPNQVQSQPSINSDQESQNIYDSYRDSENRHDRFRDWDLPASHPQMVKLAEVINRTLSHFPSEFLPEYRNPCWYADANRSAASLRCLPYFIHIGYPKCGTTETYSLLKQHPKFATPQAKESHFLVYSGSLDEELEDVYLKGYLGPATKEIAKDPDKITGDMSPTYVRNLPNAPNMPSDATPILFSTIFPNSKFIVNVRDPIDQVRSHFYYQLARKKVNASTEQLSNELHTYMKRQLQAYWACVNDTGDSLWCVYSWHYTEYLESPKSVYSESGVILQLQESVYYANLHLWLKHIKKENLLIVQLENMKENVTAVANDIYTFLGLAPLSGSALKKIASARPAHYQSFLHSTAGGKGKGASGGEDPYMKDITKRMLCRMQKPFNKALADLLPDEHFAWANSRYC